MGSEVSGIGALLAERPTAVATPTEDALERRLARFETLGEALDYAARGSRGLNFHDARGALTRPYSFAELRDDALAMAPPDRGRREAR